MAYATGILILAALFVVFAARAVTDDSPDLRSAWAATADRRTLLARTWRRLTTAAGRYYLTALILVGGILFMFVLTFYAWKLLPITAGLLDRMGKLETAGNAEATRNIAFAIAAFAGMLAVLATVPFRLVRAWIAERTARVAESNLTTDLINKAVEGLGVEKTVSRIGRPISFFHEQAGLMDNPSGRTEIEWQNRAPPLPTGHETGLKTGDWQTFNETIPNLEVRIGAIYTLERIARENPEEHIRVMEILCAYIRENAPARDAQPNPLDPFPDYPETPTPEDLQERQYMQDRRQERLRDWAADLSANHATRTDIQTALEVIGRRSQDQVAREGKTDAGGAWAGYRLDLRQTNLQAADLEHGADRPMRFQYARLTEARMEGAYLFGARLEGADLREARMEAADLSEAHLEGAHLSEAHLEGAVLNEAHLQGAELDMARMKGAGLVTAQLEGARLIGARMEGACLITAQMGGSVLRWARMEGAILGGAGMEGTVLISADLRSADWAGTHTGAPVHSADLRGGKSLTQNQLDQMIGDANTLLPEMLDDGSVPSIPTCWTTPPSFFEAMILRMSFGIADEENEMRKAFLCTEGTEPARTGTPLALDAPYPDGHPLADRED